MNPLWRSDSAAQATRGQAQGDWHVTGLSIDSRSLSPGDMFIALSAARDGHDFVADALSKGAGAAMVSRLPEGVDPTAPLLIVEDVQQGLEALARAARVRTQAKVLAITGSVGKTSTKEMAAHVLRAQAKTHAAEKSFNNHWGVPLTLARMPQNAQYGVVEIGMNHPGEIAPLARMTQPNVALVTTVGPVHLEAFADGIEGIAREKAAIYSGLGPRGCALWNADLNVSPILEAAIAGNAESFGESAQADWRLISVAKEDTGLCCVASTPWGKITFTLATEGRHFALNALAVLASCHALGADLSRAARDLAAWSPPRGRGARQFIRLDPENPDVGIDVIDDSYNANPTSVKAALTLLAQSQPSTGGRRIAILGDMKELGPEEVQLHTELSQYPDTETIDIFHCVGALMKQFHNALPEHQRGLSVAQAKEISHLIRDLLQPGDIVLVKGSLSMGMSHVVDAISELGQGQM